VFQTVGKIVRSGRQTCLKFSARDVAPVRRDPRALRAFMSEAGRSGNLVIAGAALSRSFTRKMVGGEAAPNTPRKCQRWPSRPWSRGHPQRPPATQNELKYVFRPLRLRDMLKNSKL